MILDSSNPFTRIRDRKIAGLRKMRETVAKIEPESELRENLSSRFFCTEDFWKLPGKPILVIQRSLLREVPDSRLRSCDQQKGRLVNYGMTKRTAERKREEIGRNYTATRFGVHSRRVDGDGTWYGMNNYKSREDANEHLRSIGKPILGGLVSFGPCKELFEYRIVRVEMQCTVEHVEDQMV